MTRSWHSGSVTVSRSDALERVAARADSAVPRAARRAVRGHLEPLVDRARGGWPVKTGRSRAGLNVEDEGEAGAKPINRVGYAVDVHRAGIRQSAWEELVRRPLFASRDELRDALRRYIVAALRGG